MAIRILLVEDNPGDARLIESMLEEIEFPRPTIWHVPSISSAIERLLSDRFDAVLLDLHLPDFSGVGNVGHIQAVAPETPIIVMTGLSDRTAGIEAVKRGAQDYLVKGQTSAAVLGRSLCYAIERQKLHVERERLVRQLEDALKHNKTLRGLLPICPKCKAVRNDEGYWEQIEGYIAEHSEADYTHSYCPDCVRKINPGYAEVD